MSYTVKLATFPPWKAPVPYEALARGFATTAEAAKAGEEALASFTARELDDLFPHRQSQPRAAEATGGTSITVPGTAVHGYLIYNETGAEVGNWTTLDVALERAADGQFASKSEQAD